MTNVSAHRLVALAAAERAYCRATIALRFAQYRIIVFPLLVIIASCLLAGSAILEFGSNVYSEYSDPGSLTHPVYVLSTTWSQIDRWILGNIPGEFSTTINVTAHVSNSLMNFYAFLLPFFYLRPITHWYLRSLLGVFLLHIFSVSAWSTFLSIETLRQSLEGYSSEPWEMTSNRFSTHMCTFVYSVIFMVFMSRFVFLTPDKNMLLQESWSAVPAQTERLQRMFVAFGAPANARAARLWPLAGILAWITTSLGLIEINVLLLAVGRLLDEMTTATVSYHFSPNSQSAQAVLNNFGRAIVLFGSIIGLTWLLSVRVGRAMQVRFRRLLRNTMLSALDRDARPPILFLRSFLDDAVKLPEPKFGILYRLLCASERRKTLDELILEEGSFFGPVVAIGNPVDPYPPYGAARGYFTGRSWQENVALLMSSARQIVMCIDDSEGVWWELQHLVEKNYLDKTIFFLHPKHVAPESAEQLIDKINDVTGGAVRLRASSALTDAAVFPTAFTLTAIGTSVVYATNVPSRASYLCVLRSVMRDQKGN